MSSLTTYPRQDQWESTLTADINAADTTIPVSIPPSFSMTTGGANSFYVVIDYDVTAKFEIAECDGISGNNVIVKTGGRGKPKYEGGASTAVSHAAGAKIMITDTWKNYADAATAIATKLDTAGGTITGSLTITNDLIVSDDTQVIGDLTLTTPLSIASGGTGAITDTLARAALSAAKSGANSDITSLASLSTPLSVAQGGTGANTLASNNLIKGNGTGAVANLAPGTAGQVVTSNGTDWLASDAPIVGTAKALLSNVNTTDGNNDGVTRGALVVGNSTPKWSKLAVGVDGQVLKSDGTDVLWGSLYPTQFLQGLPFGSSSYAGVGYISNDGLSICQLQSTSMYKLTRSATTKPFKTYIIAQTSGGNSSPSAHYYEGGADYSITKTSAANSLTRSSFSTGTTGLMTISGTAPGTYGTIMAWDKANSYLLIREGATTQIRRYTISGTTVTNINSDITLSANPTGAASMWVVGSEIWIIDWDGSKNSLLKYSMAGTQLSATPFATAQNFMVIKNYNADYLEMLVQCGATSSVANYTVKIDI